MFMWGVVRQQNEGEKEWAGAGAQECDWYKSLDLQGTEALAQARGEESASAPHKVGCLILQSQCSWFSKALNNVNHTRQKARLR